MGIYFNLPCWSSPGNVSVYSGLNTAGLDGLTGPSILILGFFACPLLVWPQELFSQKVRVERGKVKIGGCGGGEIGKTRSQKVGVPFLASPLLSMCNH